MKLPIHPAEDFAQATFQGLSQSPKQLSPKFLYDRRGSELFDRICQCREYYVTRTETAILEMHAPDIAEEIGDHALLIEYGSGASRKTRILLSALKTLKAYVPIDISKEFLQESAEALRREFPRFAIWPVCADFTQPLQNLDLLKDPIMSASNRKVAFFPGSTIGNMDRTDAQRFLSNTAKLLGQDGLFLLGVDLIKDITVLEPAYDDSEGITAAFNLNLLHRMQRELGAKLDIDGFRHRAFFNEKESRIEMHLESLRKQSIEIRSQRFEFEPGETLHTECSYKYDPASFQDMAQRAGLSVRRVWMDEKRYFAVYLLQTEANPYSLAA